MVGDRDRPEAAVAGRLQQDLDRRRAVRRVVGVHVQVDLDQRPPDDPLPRLGVPDAVVAAGQRAGGRSPQLGRDLGPVALGARPARRPRRNRGSSARAGSAVAADGHRAGVEAAEEDLDQRPRDLGREDPLLGRVEGGDVERDRSGAARSRRSRGAKGSWTWTMSNEVVASRFLTGSPEPSTCTSWPRRSSSAETPLTYSLTWFRVPRR